MQRIKTLSLRRVVLGLFAYATSRALCGVGLASGGHLNAYWRSCLCKTLCEAMNKLVCSVGSGWLAGWGLVVLTKSNAVYGLRPAERGV